MASWIIFHLCNTTFYLLMNTGIAFAFWPLRVMLLWTSVYKDPFMSLLSMPWGQVLGRGTAGSHGHSSLHSGGPLHCFPRWQHLVTFLPAKHEGSDLSTSSPTLVIAHFSFVSLFFVIAIPNGRDLYLPFFNIGKNGTIAIYVDQEWGGSLP